MRFPAYGDASRRLAMTHILRSFLSLRIRGKAANGDENPCSRSDGMLH
jgi:hypothetical protein